MATNDKLIEGLDHRVTALDSRVRRLEVIVAVLVFATIGGAAWQSRALGALETAVTQRTELDQTALARLNRVEATQAGLIALEGPANGMATMTPPELVDGKWRATVALFDQTKVVRWETNLKSNDDPQLENVVVAATQSDVVRGVRLSDLNHLAPLAIHIDPERSFLVLGDVEACRRNLIAQFGQPRVTLPLQGTPPKTGRDFVGL